MEILSVIIAIAAGAIIVKKLKNRNYTAVVDPNIVIYYATNPHNLNDNEYRFTYRKVGSSWRAYIKKMPDLRGRPTDGAVTHRLYDAGKPFVCWDRSVGSMKDMVTISKVWADSIQEYIATGRRFG